MVLQDRAVIRRDGELPFYSFKTTHINAAPECTPSAIFALNRRAAAGRLNSGVRLHIMILGRFVSRVVIGIFLVSTCPGVSLAGAADDEIHIVGRLVSVKHAPGCGMFVLGSPATYQVISGQDGLVGLEIQVLIACIEIPLIEGDVNIFNVGDIHALIVTHHNINKIDLPDSTDGSGFYLKTASFLAMRPNNSFKLKSYQGRLLPGAMPL